MAWSVYIMFFTIIVWALSLKGVCLNTHLQPTLKVYASHVLYNIGLNQIYGMQISPVGDNWGVFGSWFVLHDK